MSFFICILQVYERLYTIQEDIGAHFLDKVVEEVKDGKTFSFVIDNIDWEEHVHEMRSDNQNESVHAVATSIVFDRVSSSHLPDEEPQQSLASCDVVKLVQLSDSDIAIQKQVYKSIAAHILCEYIPTFKFLKDLVTHFDVPMQHKVEMQQKSLVVPFPVLFKDEKKYAEIVDVLDQLEKWVHQIYALVGKIPPEKDISNAHHVTLRSLPSTSQPDQPLSHVHPVADPNDPLAKVRVPCYGDQITRVRIAGAKDLRAGCHTARDQISHIYPIKCADWHCKRSFLKVMHALHLNCYNETRQFIA